MPIMICKWPAKRLISRRWPSSGARANGSSSNQGHSLPGRRRKLHGYLGAVSQVDAPVGKLLDHLRRLDLARDTIVVYTSDHGDYATELWHHGKGAGYLPVMPSHAYR